MLFNTFEFFIFFAIVYALYRIFNHRWQNILLLVASYFFYGCWSWKFLSLIAISTVIDYFCGIHIEQSNDQRRRKILLGISMAANLGILGFFKYFNFFAENLTSLLTTLGVTLNTSTLSIILPVGISFYTFQTMSYTIDIYRGKMKPTHNFLDFALFVSFFPQLVAGPIERAKALVPQVTHPRTITTQQMSEGVFLFFWGLFKKVFIADNLAVIVEQIFSETGSQNGILVMIGVVAFAFQIYGDFSGYSDMARGLAKVMGFELMLNFNLPYFSLNPSDFWRRWHISLSSWLKDYLYIGLGGNRKGNFNTYRNLMLTMLLGGLWHGAGWTYILWGFYQGLILVVHRFSQPLLKRVFRTKNPVWLKVGIWSRIGIMFIFANIGWLIFRAQSVQQIWNMFTSMLFNSNLQPLGDIKRLLANVLFYAGPLVIIQFIQYTRDDLLVLHRSNAWVKGLVYFVLILIFLVAGVQSGQSFIYFQF